jgi:hypothetical protein
LGVDVIVGGTAVAVGGMLVAVGGMLVAVGGTAVAVAGTLVAVGGTAVAVGGTSVGSFVGGPASFVGCGVFVGLRAASTMAASVKASETIITISVPVKSRPRNFISEPRFMKSVSFADTCQVAAVVFVLNESI